MSTTLSIVFSHPHGDHRIGDTADLPAADARRLIRAGVAVPAETPTSSSSSSKRTGSKRKRSTPAPELVELDDDQADDEVDGEPSSSS